MFYLRGRGATARTLAVAIWGLGLAAWSSQGRPAWSQDRSAGGDAAKAAGAKEDRRKALQLSDEHRDLEALPLLEALAKADPMDRLIRERLAVVLVTKALAVKREEAPALLRRARSILIALKETGPMSEVAEVLVETLPVDGGIPKHSDRADVEAAMKRGEAAFARRDFLEAREAYRKALKLDPRLYTAALFVGDAYFVEGRLPEAATWFTRAVIIDPNREVAYRYHGDALIKAGMRADARSKYLDAVIAEPYSRRPWDALGHWSRLEGVRLSHPRIVPAELEPRDEKHEAKAEGPAVKAGAPDDGRSHWGVYTRTREAWSGGRFKEAFPREPAYRHTLVEEADALQQVALAVAKDFKAGRIKEPNPCFLNLVKLIHEGLLDAHILYARADEGIAQDYEAYRDKHRGELRRYLTEYVVPSKDAGNPPAADTRPDPETPR